MLAESESPSAKEERVALEDFEVFGDEKRRMSEKRRVFLWRCWCEEGVQSVIADTDVASVEDMIVSFSLLS